jgi:hypothetical protein
VATIVTTVPVGGVYDWHWTGPRDDFRDFCNDLGAPRLADRVAGLASSRGR